MVDDVWGEVETNRGVVAEERCLRCGKNWRTDGNVDDGVGGEMEFRGRDIKFQPLAPSYATKRRTDMKATVASRFRRRSRKYNRPVMIDDDFLMMKRIDSATRRMTMTLFFVVHARYK